MAQLNELRRQNRELRQETEDLNARLAATGPGGDGAGLQAELAELRADRQAAHRARQQAEEEAARLKAQLTSGGAGRGGDYEALIGRATDLYEAINDIASDLRMNVDLAYGYLEDLKPLFELFGNLPMEQIKPALRERIRQAVTEADAAETAESAEEVLASARSATETFKKSLRTFRGVLQQHGYGS